MSHKERMFSMKESKADQKFEERGLFFSDLYGFSNKLTQAEKK